MVDLTIVYATPVDATAWRELRAALWPDDEARHADEIGTALAGDDGRRLALLARMGSTAVGLAEASIRHDYVNGCDGPPVAFLEALYVDPVWRRRGIARELVDRVAAWARAEGMAELGSDAMIDNVAGHLLHRALGFEETERVVFFRRELMR